jgi:hypothetical protein
MGHGPALLLATAVTVVGHEGATRTALLSAWTTINRPAEPARAGLGKEKVGADSKREERNGAGNGQDGSRGEEPPPSPDELAEPNVVTEQSVMREFVARHHERLRFNHDSKSGWYGNEHYWKPDRRQLAFSWSLDICRSKAPTRTVQKVRFSAAVETGAHAMREVATAQEDWDRATRSRHSARDKEPSYS